MAKKIKKTKCHKYSKNKLLKKVLAKIDDHIEDSKFSGNIASIRGLFSQYSAGDIAISLCISELWLPNISSQIKHIFAQSIFLSMNSTLFEHKTRINTYRLFREFVRELYRLLPSFPSLEDYIPEQDWGEIRIYADGQFRRTFYGGGIERITDFATAFKFRFLSTDKTKSDFSWPIKDLHTALEIQDYLLSTIDKPSSATFSNISTGYLGIPVKRFWEQCYKSLYEFSTNVRADTCSSKLIMEQGSYQMPKTLNEFGNALFDGVLMPAFISKVGNSYFPISPRRVIEVVLDYWESLGEKDLYTHNTQLTCNLSAFLAQRFPSKDIQIGAFRLATRHKKYEHLFWSILFDSQKVFFLINSQPSIVADHMRQVEMDLFEVISSDMEFAIFCENKLGYMQLNVNPNDVELIAVVSHCSSKPLMIRPHQNSIARIFSLPDFVSIFDSLSSISELNEFFRFIDEGKDIRFPGLGMTDLFASFRDSHGVLVDGAIQFNSIFLNPHTGSNWRYEELKKFWEIAPKQFPDNNNIAWHIDEPEKSSLRLQAKNNTEVSQYVQVNRCSTHFIVDVKTIINLGELNAQLLDLFSHCISDALLRQSQYVEDISIFNRERLITRIYSNPDLLAVESDEVSNSKLEASLFSNWKQISESSSNDLEISVQVNLFQVCHKLVKPADASFEVASFYAWLRGVCEMLKFDIDRETTNNIMAHCSAPPRFNLLIEKRKVDVPNYGQAFIPSAIHYKKARKNMAILFKEHGVSPGKYELKKAKEIIDPVRNKARELVHTIISGFKKDSLVSFCVEQLDMLNAEYSRGAQRIRMSMSHEVDYDRAEELAKQHEEYIRNNNNYRYLLECCLSNASCGTELASMDNVAEVIATVDWLMILYGVSDVIHNDIDAAGINIDDFFIPENFYSTIYEEKREGFEREYFEFRLGIGLNEDDFIKYTINKDDVLNKLDQAFKTDAGFLFKDLLQVLYILTKWPSMRAEDNLSFSYKASKEDIIQTLVSSLTDQVAVNKNELERAIDFLTLLPSKIRHLVGKDCAESDVPIWEHNKRDNRYTIKPLVPIDTQLIWGASTAYKAYYIWHGAISAGYLPADFSLPSVVKVVRDIKESIEKELESSTTEICSRTLEYCIRGIDFKRRFSRESFDDVGDFDVLAYKPDTNQWVTIECKYNQPPYCLKDARRLRERIFGNGNDHGQFSKIERRREFLVKNFGKIRSLLKWPEPSVMAPVVHELYVSRDIFWWMHNTPYEVPTTFVRIDALDGWLKENLGG